MNTENNYDDKGSNKNEIRAKGDELNLNQFILNDLPNRNSKVLFHEVLKTLVYKYNTLNEKERREEGIYFIKDSNILLGNITEEVIQTYNNYKTLYYNLMAGKTRFFREYDPKLDKDSIKALSENNNANSNLNLLRNALFEFQRESDNITCYMTHKKNYKNYEDYRTNKKKIKYNLKHFSFNFYGMYFETTSLETFFKLIEDECHKVQSDKKLMSTLPRIIFFMKNPEDKKCYTNKSEKNIYGFSEIDSIFVLNIKEKVGIGKENITCLDKFDINDANLFFNEDNFVNLTLEKDDVVFMEVKSHFESVIDKYGQKNILIKFINKSLKFIEYYEKLNLIKKDQKIVLIFLYNNLMYYNIRVENSRIREAYELIKYNKRIKLYIAYYQSYLKIMNPYQRVIDLKELSKKIKGQQKE